MSGQRLRCLPDNFQAYVMNGVGYFKPPSNSVERELDPKHDKVVPLRTTDNVNPMLLQPQKCEPSGLFGASAKSLLTLKVLIDKLIDHKCN